MGREERVRHAMEQAEYERVVGPTREFPANLLEIGCEKCGAKAFNVAWCLGRRVLADSPNRCQLEGEHLHWMCSACRHGFNSYCRDDATGEKARENAFAIE